MPGTTPVLALPYPLGTDPPAGHTQIQALAQKVEDVSARGLFWHRVDTNTTAPTTSAGYATAPNWPAPNVNLKAGRAYKVTAFMGVLSGSNNFVKGILRIVRGGSDLQWSGYVSGPGILGTITIVTVYSVPTDQPVAIELGYGVYFGGSTCQFRNDLVIPYVVIEDIGAMKALTP